MKILLPVSILLAAATGAAAAWFLPIHREIAGRPVAKVDAAGQAVTALPLSSLTPEDKARADALRLRVDALDAKLEAHDAEIAAGWNEIMADLDRENARRKVEGDRIASVVNATGVKPVEAQVEDLMDDTARKRVKGVVGMWIKGEVAGLKTRLALAPQQSAAIDIIVDDILKEEGARIDSEEPGDNFMGWRGDVLQSARQKLHERVDPLLTSEQKAKAKDYLKDEDWARAWREGGKEEGK